MEAIDFILNVRKFQVGYELNGVQIEVLKL